MALFLLKFIILVTLQILLFYYTILYYTIACDLNLVNDIFLIFIISTLLIVIIIAVTKYLIFINEHTQI